jgi:hypothetical protein
LFKITEVAQFFSYVRAFFTEKSYVITLTKKIVLGNVLGDKKLVGQCFGRQKIGRAKFWATKKLVGQCFGRQKNGWAMFWAIFFTKNAPHARNLST